MCCYKKSRRAIRRQESETKPKHRQGKGRPSSRCNQCKHTRKHARTKTATRGEYTRALKTVSANRPITQTDQKANPDVTKGALAGSQTTSLARTHRRRQVLFNREGEGEGEGFFSPLLFSFPFYSSCLDFLYSSVSDL